MSAPPVGPPGAGRPETGRAGGRQWLWDHIGRIAGLVLGLAAFALVVVLAAAGWPPAYGLVVLVVIGVAMIAVGGRIKGA